MKSSLISIDLSYFLIFMARTLHGDDVDWWMMRDDDDVVLLVSLRRRRQAVVMDMDTAAMGRPNNLRQ